MAPAKHMLLTLALVTCAAGHGCMFEPNPRGCLTSNSDFIPHGVDENAPTDYMPHFPAGDKSSTPGSGKRSQEIEAGPKGWTPFRPLEQGFKWRSGVCGDKKGGVEDHRRGGEYFYGAKRVATYRQGGTMEVGISIVAHHNGFMALYICNAGKCGGDVSESCFRDGHCQELERARNSECDSGQSMRCGPIDRNHKNRWYLPCTAYPGNDFKIETFGPNTILYRLPERLTCEHCTVVWYWATANSCNPDGVRDYHTGPDRPVAWARSQCRGQAGSVGGVDLNRGECGGRDFAEEYLQCADVTIVPGSGDRASASVPERRSPVSSFDKPVSVPTTKAPVTKAPKKKSPKKKAPKKGGGGGGSSYDVQRGMEMGYGEVRDIVLIGNGKRIVSLNEKSEVSVGSYGSVSIEAITESQARNVEFYVDGARVNTVAEAPFYIRGRGQDGRAIGWKFQRDDYVNIKVCSGGDCDTVRVILRS